MTWRCCVTSRIFSGRWRRMRLRGGPGRHRRSGPGPHSVARARAGNWRGRQAAETAGCPFDGGGFTISVVLDLDATIVICHSEKESAAKTWKRTFGFHPLLCFSRNGEALAGLLRPGTLARTRRPTTSPCSTRRWRRSPTVTVRATTSSSGATRPAPPRLPAPHPQPARAGDVSGRNRAG